MQGHQRWESRHDEPSMTRIPFDANKDGGALSRPVQHLWLLPSGPDQVHAFPSVRPPPMFAPSGLFLRLPPCEDACNEGQYVGSARFIITVVPDQALLDNVNLFLRRLVHHVRNQRSQLNRIFLILE